MPPTPSLVEAGLDGDHVADDQHLVAPGHEVRRLGVAEADAVARVVGEEVEEVERLEMATDDGLSTSLGLRARLQGTASAASKAPTQASNSLDLILGRLAPSTTKVLVKSPR